MKQPLCKHAPDQWLIALVVLPFAVFGGFAAFVPGSTSTFMIMATCASILTLVGLYRKDPEVKICLDNIMRWLFNSGDR